jgi:hypothetical protein
LNSGRFRIAVRGGLFVGCRFHIGTSRGLGNCGLRVTPSGQLGLVEDRTAGREAAGLGKVAAFARPTPESSAAYAKEGGGLRRAKGFRLHNALRLPRNVAGRGGSLRTAFTASLFRDFFGV